MLQRLSPVQRVLAPLPGLQPNLLPLAERRVCQPSAVCRVGWELVGVGAARGPVLLVQARSSLRATRPSQQTQGTLCQAGRHLRRRMDRKQPGLVQKWQRLLHRPRRSRRRAGEMASQGLRPEALRGPSVAAAG